MCEISQNTFFLKTGLTAAFLIEIGVWFHAVFEVTLKLFNVLARPDYQDFRKSCRMQNLCLKLLIGRGLQAILMGKAAIKVGTSGHN